MVGDVKPTRQTEANASITQRTIAPCKSKTTSPWATAWVAKCVAVLVTNCRFLKAPCGAVYTTKLSGTFGSAHLKAQVQPCAVMNLSCVSDAHSLRFQYFDRPVKYRQITPRCAEAKIAVGFYKQGRKAKA